MKFLRRVLSVVMIIIAIVMLCLAIYFSGGTAGYTLTLFGVQPVVLSTWHFLGFAAVAALSSFFLDSEQSGNIIRKVGEAGSAVVDSVFDVVDSVVDNTASSTTSAVFKFLPLILIGGVGYIIYNNITSASNDDKIERIEDED